MHEQTSAVPYGYCHCGCGEKTPLANRTSRRDGTVKGEPVRFVGSHHFRLPRFKGPRFIEEDRGHSSPCWIWQMALNPSGYGLIPGRGSRLAHRAFYEDARGPIPGGPQLDHLCRTRCCVNPDHLEPVTNAENQRRSPRTKLTMVDAETIRALVSEGVSQREVGRRFGISHNRVGEIVRGEGWT